MRQQPQANRAGVAQLPLGDQYVPDGGTLNTFSPPNSQTSWCNWSSQAQMLGYLEQAALYNAINFNFTPEWNGQPAWPINSTVSLTVINTFLCPSDGNAGKGYINSYACSQGTTTYGYPFSDTDYNTYHKSTGAFAYQNNYSIANFTDGTSNTVAFSEWLVNDPNANGPRMPRATGNTGSNGSLTVDTNIVGLAAVQADLQTCSKTFQTSQGNGPGSTWATGAMGYTMFNTVVPPNGGGNVKWSACRMGCCAQAQHADYVNATSNHSGGVNVMMADGSVRFIKNSISFQTWWAVGTRANGEAISADSY